MGCRATRRNMIIVLLITFFYALIFTSKVSAEVINNDYPTRTTSFEVKPVALLTNLIPGSRGFAGEFEASLGRSISVVAGLNHYSLRLSNESVEEQKQNPENTEVEKSIATSDISLGGRYYNNIAGHSWFLGARFGGGTKKSLWDHESTEYIDSQMTYHSAVDSGYRWLWNSGLHLRLGGGLEFHRTISRNITHLSDNKEPDQVARSIEKNNPTNGIRFNPYFDFGLGITI